MPGPPEARGGGPTVPARGEIAASDEPPQLNPSPLPLMARDLLTQTSRLCLPHQRASRPPARLASNRALGCRSRRYSPVGSPTRAKCLTALWENCAADE